MSINQVPRKQLLTGIGGSAGGAPIYLNTESGAVERDHPQNSSKNNTTLSEVF
jgi:hypothetical protein